MSIADAGTFDVEALGKEMIDAARAALTGHRPALQEMAELEIRRLAGALADIGALLEKGKIDPERAKTLAQIHQLTVRSVLRSVEGQAILTADDALQAITDVAGAVVNRVLGFKLL